MKNSASILFICFLLSAKISIAQVSVSGPSCVLPGTTYTYLINGSWDSTSTMQVCISGGTIAGSTTNCSPTSSPQSYVLVVWSSGVTGSFQVNSSKGNASINVSISEPLSGGQIQSGKSQSITYNTVPSAISCSTSSGGSCSPSYNYQWQQSLNAVAWTNIPGATSINLNVTTNYQQATFFRRKVTDTSSGSIAYSDMAVVDVQAPPPTAH